MIKLKDILNEENNPFDNLIKLYHGGQRWNQWTASINQPKKGRYEAGAGIYLTTKYETASKYAKGSNIVSLVGVSKDIKLSDNINIPLTDCIEFIKTYIGQKSRNEFLTTIKNSAQRSNKDSIPANYLLNLSVNLEVGGKQALDVMKFVVNYGVDASIVSQSNNEEWLVVHNPKIIKKVVHTKPSDINVDDYDLPSISKQISHD